MAGRGGRTGGRGRENFRGRGNGGRGRGSGGRQRGSDDRVVCQLCGKEGHTILKWYKRFDHSFTGAPEKSTSSATTLYGIDTNWYVDSGVTDHITRELEKLTVRDKYNGVDQVHTTSGAGMKIDQTGHSFVHTLDRDLLLNNVLFVPKANKNLVSVHKLALDNHAHAFLEFHPSHFLSRTRQQRKHSFEAYVKKIFIL
jgi:hypothetical protein